VLPALEIAAGAALVVLVIAQRLRQYLAVGGVAGVELAGAVMMFIEAFGKLEEKHHKSFYVVSFIPPLVMLAFAAFDAQINQMRRMKCDDDGFVMKVRLLWSRRVAWRDVDSWSRSAKSIDVTLRNGRTKRFRFNGVENRDAAMEWAAAQFTRRVSAPDELPARQRDAEERDRDEVSVAGERGAK